MNTKQIHVCFRQQIFIKFYSCLLICLARAPTEHGTKKFICIYWAFRLNFCVKNFCVKNFCACLRHVNRIFLKRRFPLQKFPLQFFYKVLQAFFFIMIMHHWFWLMFWPFWPHAARHSISLDFEHWIPGRRNNIKWNSV